MCYFGETFTSRLNKSLSGIVAQHKRGVWIRQNWLCLYSEWCLNAWLHDTSGMRISCYIHDLVGLVSVNTFSKGWIFGHILTISFVSILPLSFQTVDKVQTRRKVPDFDFNKFYSWQSWYNWHWKPACHPGSFCLLSLWRQKVDTHIANQYTSQCPWHKTPVHTTGSFSLTTLAYLQTRFCRKQLHAQRHSYYNRYEKRIRETLNKLEVATAQTKPAQIITETHLNLIQMINLIRDQAPPVCPQPGSRLDNRGHLSCN